jgi:hypothetical protein
MRELTDVRILWDSDWHDGPVSGLAEYEGQQCWFQADWDDALDEWAYPRKLILYALNPVELEVAWAIHRQFESQVSTRHCHHDDAPPATLQPQSGWLEFYDAYPPGIATTYEDHRVVGYCIVPK